MAATYSHAGCVVLRESDGGREVLIARSSNGRDWILPKGRIDPGETAEEAAVREVREEAGAVGYLLGVAGESTYRKNGSRVRVIFYAMRFQKLVPADEDRELRWLSLDRAIERLGFEDADMLVRNADALLDSAG